MFVQRDRDNYIIASFFSMQDFAKEEISETSREWLDFIGKTGIYSKPLEELKSSKKQEINQAREQARLDEGAEYNNDLFDIDEKSQANITAIVSMLIANNVPNEYTCVYRSKTNVNHLFTKSQMIELGTVIGAKVTEIYQKSWELKEQVDKATTKEELEGIKWE
ncbi:MAG: hypothetical protein BWY74_03217 [Firmicutes bacterium ADurb.Bin419]|nr:MAG: hypothetical protein BWY74_03217 [Firmicutes bacterium ADurb.Bin419]